MSEEATVSTLSRKSEATRQKLIEAGIRLFSANGYEATSTRQVQTAAGVQRNLITYHFGSKESFWKACAADLFARIGATMRPAVSQARDIEPGERLRFLIRQFVRASAAHPEITRIMFDEGRSDSWRLTWIIDEYVQDFFNLVADLHTQGTREEIVPPVSVVQFYYALVGSAAVFAMAPECKRLTGEDPFSQAFIDAQADAVATLLTKIH
ncbi:MAG: TetR family transcriptional regulator [Pseudomonadota bacterium]